MVKQLTKSNGWETLRQRGRPNRQRSIVVVEEVVHNEVLQQQTTSSSSSSTSSATATRPAYVVVNNDTTHMHISIGHQLRKLADDFQHGRKTGRELGAMGDHLMATYEGDDEKAHVLHKELRRLHRCRSCG